MKRTNYGEWLCCHISGKMYFSKHVEASSKAFLALTAPPTGWNAVFDFRAECLCLVVTDWGEEPCQLLEFWRSRVQSSLTCKSSFEPEGRWFSCLKGLCVTPCLSQPAPASKALAQVSLWKYIAWRHLLFFSFFQSGSEVCVSEATSNLERTRFFRRRRRRR